MNTPDPRATATFGPFELRPDPPVLLDRGTPVRLGSRAMALLRALVAQAGAVLSRSELEAKVWPATVVEETSLRVQIAALRKALGDRQDGGRYIINVIGRGYSFVAPVAWRKSLPMAVPGPEAPARHNLPARRTRVFGRDAVVAALGQQVARKRLLSIVGVGGIGKTSVALLVAEAACPAFEHGVCFVDLAPVSEPGAVASTLVAALAGAAPTADAMPTLRALLGERRMLLVFDNCEHVVGAVAVLCEALLRAGPGVSILATTREPLNVEGEALHRLAPLPTPGPQEELSVEQALAYPALQLFVERARANADGFALSPANLPWVRQVCWRLDGMPLAIEFAAARVATLGAHQLADGLEDVFQLLGRRRSASDSRHQALKAVLEWSHRLLGDDEQKVLRRIAVFRAGFTLEAAGRVCADEVLDEGAAVGHFLSLVDKSLITRVPGAYATYYRLLFTTRKFAELQLAAAGETELMRLRQARYFHDKIDAWRADPQAMGMADFLEFFQVTFEDTSAAIDWALAAEQTRELGIQLALRCNMFDVAHLDPQMVRFERIVRDVLALQPPRPQLEMFTLNNWCRLSGMSNVFLLRQDEMFTRFRAAFSEADRTSQVISLQSMSIAAFGQGDYRTSVGFAEELGTYHDQPMAARQSERMLALNLHFLGEQDRARTMAQALADEVLTAARAPELQSARRAFPIRLVLARILWLQGQVDQAVAAVEAALDESTEAYPFARCKVLGLAAIPVALWCGDLEAAASANRQLRGLVERHSMGYWRAWSGSFDRIIEARRQGRTVLMPLEGPAAHDLPRRNLSELDGLPTFAEELLTQRAIERVETGQVGWCAPEILRLQARRVLRDGGDDAQAAAQALLQRSLAAARAQGALSWELRAACDLSRLWHQQGRSHEAHALLGAVHGRFVEGHQTADLVAARRLLNELPSLGGDATHTLG